MKLVKPIYIYIERLVLVMYRQSNEISSHFLKYCFVLRPLCRDYFLMVVIFVCPTKSVCDYPFLNIQIYVYIIYIKPVPELCAILTSVYERIKHISTERPLIT